MSLKLKASVDIDIEILGPGGDTWPLYLRKGDTFECHVLSEDDYGHADVYTSGGYVLNLNLGLFEEVA